MHSCSVICHCAKPPDAPLADKPAHFCVSEQYNLMALTYFRNNGWFITRILCCTLFFLWRVAHIIHMTFRYVVTFPSSGNWFPSCVYIVIYSRCKTFQKLAVLPKRRLYQLYRRYDQWLTLCQYSLWIPQTVTGVTRNWFEPWPENHIP
jgi:hypothetical protein